MYKFLVLPLFFAAVSAGYLGSPYSYGHGSYAHAAPALSYAHAAPLTTYAAHSAPYSYGHSHSYSAPLATYAHAAPAVYSAPIVKSIAAPVHYAHAPVAVKHVVPAATSYANTYKVSHSVAPVVHHAAPIAAYTAHAAPIAYKSYSAPLATAYHGASYAHHAAPLAYAAHSAPLSYAHGFDYGHHGYLH